MADSEDNAVTNDSVTTGPMSDADLLNLFRTVETDDFVRDDPPEPVWTSVLVGVRDAQLQQEQAREGSRAIAGPRGVPRLMLIAAALLSVVLGGAFLAQSLGGDDPEPVASAFMTDEGLPVATNATATATVVCDDGGECAVEVDLTAVPDAGAGALELWVINADVTDMHSLGIIEGSGSYPLPAGVNAATDFPIVDISVEPNDGDETHSGQSVLRGALS